MLPWKPLLAVVPAGLLVGLMAGQASRPEMIIKDDRPWPASVAEAPDQSDSWPSFDLSAPVSTVRGYSYRPDIDYDRFVWPDQTDSSAELLAADFDYAPYERDFDAGYRALGDLPLTRSAVAELSAREAERVVDAASVPAAAPVRSVSVEAPGNPTAERAGFVLPAVPPPLAKAGELPEEPEFEESEEEVF